MIINIQEIINSKVKEMEGKQLVEKAIQETLEKSILNAVTDTMDSYSLQREIRDMLDKQVSDVVKNIGFEAYNSFISEKLTQIINGVCRKDIEEKIKKTFDDILILKRENVKLSEIFETYKEWICEDTDDQEKHDLEGRFYVKFEKSDYGWYNVELGKEKPERYSDRETIKFTVHKNNDGTGWLGSVYIDGYNIEKTLEFGYLTSVEALLINAHYNKTPVIIDVEDEDDIDTSFDIDY